MGSLPLVGAGPSSGGSFSPLSLSPAAWLKADALALNDGDPVGTWTDSSGNGRDATQGTAAAKPTYKTAIVNGLAVVRFDGTDDILSFAANFVGTTNSIFAVCAPAAGGLAGDKMIFAQRRATISDLPIAPQMGLTGGKPTFDWRNDAGTLARATSVTTATAGVFLRFTAIQNGTAMTMRINAAQVATATNAGGAVTITNATVGGTIANSTTVVLAADLAELIVYPTALSATDRDSVESYLASKYGL